jgi:hypothetical protein
MKVTLFAFFASLLMVGCGQEIAVPQVIECAVCGKEVSSAGEACQNCSHPIADTVVAYKKAQELARIRAEEEDRLAAIRAEEEQKRQEEERRRQEEERRLAAIRAEEEAKAQSKHIGLDDHRIILNALYNDRVFSSYTGWVKWMYDNGQIKLLTQYKEGKPDGLSTKWYGNGQKKEEWNYKDGKVDGVWINYKEDGTELSRDTYKDGKRVFD